MTSDIIEASREFVKNIYEERTEQTLLYHNLKHTETVFNAAMTIGNNTDNVTDADLEILALAALFHDVGYVFSSKEHEKRSTEIASEFLGKQTFEADKIELINRLIMATTMGHSPSDLLEEIMQDADTCHLGNTDYTNTTYCDLYEEVKEMHMKELTKEEWAVLCVDFFQNHTYYTDYAKANYDENKAKNLQKINLLLTDKLENKTEGEKENKTEDERVPMEITPVKKKQKKKGAKKKSKPDTPEKGVETMFRVALRNHMNLSRIADNKANTLISVNAIIISIALSALFPKLDSNPYLIYPGLSLIIFSIITIIIAILSTIPKTTHGRLSKKEVEEKKGNLIFFGNFHKMSLEDYEWGVGELMKDKEYLYKTLIRDLYFLGKVLNRKYNLLRWSYYIFVTGLIITIALSVYSTEAITA